ncbi:MAG: M48 family metalloprotease [Planctomycetes bacterium]|nr:M48 family metalloprotease [Planctomycetota bacterium]
MGYLTHIVLALVAQALVEGGLSTHEVMPLAVLSLVFVPHVLSFLAHRLFIAGRFKPGELAYRLLSASAPLLYLIALSVFGWQATVAEWTGRSSSFLSWPDWSVVLVFLPFVVFELAAIDARARVTVSARERTRWRTFQWRMFASGLAPLALYLAVALLVGLSEPLRVRIETVGVWSALFVLVMLGVLGWTLPFLLKNTWEMEPVPEGPQRDVLLSVAEMARFGEPKLFVWKTGYTTANAAIVGVTKKSRVVLFSDSLLAQMGPSELAAVFAHEMGHAFRRHVPIFVVFVLGFVMLGDLLAQHYFSEQPVWAGVTIIGVMTAWFFSFGFLSRRFELEADLFSQDLLGEVRSLISALEKVGGHFRDIASWRHFSTAERVNFLERAQVDPNVGRRLKRDLRRFTYLGIALFVATGVLQVTRLWGSFAEDEVRADLRLGHYERAQERMQASDSIDPGLRAAVERAYEAREDSSIPALAGRALSALQVGDVARAREWLQLGALRGDMTLAVMDEYLAEHGASNLPAQFVQRLIALTESSKRGAQ